MKLVDWISERALKLTCTANDMLPLALATRFKEGIHKWKDEDRDVLRAELDEGEAEAIALCREAKAGTVLLDEKDARRAARRLGLTVLGTVGILIWARRTGRIARMSDQLSALQTRGKFRLSSAVCEEALRAVGEEVS